MGLTWCGWEKNKRSWYVIHKCTGSVAGCSFSFKGVHWVHYMIRYQKKCRQKKPASRSALDKEAQFQLYHMEPHFCASICLMMCRFVKKSLGVKICIFLFLLWQNRVFSSSMSNRVKTSQLGKWKHQEAEFTREWLQCWDRWTWQEMCLNFKFLDSWV